jgi:hypothetical protein
MVGKKCMGEKEGKVRWAYWPVLEFIIVCQAEFLKMCLSYN